MALADEIKTLKTETLASRELGLSGATWIGISGIEGLTANQVQHALQQLAEKSFSAQSVLVAGGGAAQVWTDMPSAITEFRGLFANRFRLDFTGATQARIVANVATAGVTGSELFFQYSADNGTTWQSLVAATISAPLTPAGDRVSAWGPIPVGAKADVLLRLVGRSGNGAADPAIGNVYLEVK